MDANWRVLLRQEGGDENAQFKLGVNPVQTVNSNLLVMGFWLILVFLLVHKTAKVFARHICIHSFFKL